MQLKHLRKMIEGLPDDLNVKIAVNMEFGGKTMSGGATIDSCRCLSYLVNDSQELSEAEPDFTPNSIILANAVLNNKGWEQARMPSMVQIHVVDSAEQAGEEERIIRCD
jgi:hypothetical protein